MEDMKGRYINKTILLVEDEYMNQRLMEFVLEPTGVEIIVAKNGLEAVEFAKKYESIDLILMDIGLPELNGYDAMVEIRKFNNKTPIIAQTAYNEAQLEENGQMDKKFDHYLEKPFNLEKNLSLFDQYLLKQ